MDYVTSTGIAPIQPWSATYAKIILADNWRPCGGRELSMSKRPVSLASACLWVALAAVAGCAKPATGRGDLQPTVEPLTEAEFDAFATDISEQIIAWLERGQVPLPVTITPPAVEEASVESGGVAKAFSQRFANGLSDRLIGAVRFGRRRANGPPLRCAISFTKADSGQPTRMVTFRLWDADSNLEICRGSYDYQARPKPLTALRRELEERRLAARIPTDERDASAAVAPVEEPVVAAVEPAKPGPLGSGAEFSESGVEQPPGQPAALQPVATAAPSGEPAPVTAVDEPPQQQRAASRQPSPAAPMVSSAVRDSEDMRRAEFRRKPRRRPVRIDRHERGLAQLVQEQAVYFNDQTVTDQFGNMIFLDRRAWESIQIQALRGRQTPDRHLSIQLLVQARSRPLEADVRVIYLDADGQQLEVSPVRTYEFWPSYAKNIVLRSSKAGAARYIVLVSHG
jgi:hypothetical protein